MDEDTGSIDELKTKLYSRDESNVPQRTRRTLREKFYGVQQHWRGKTPTEEPSMPQKKRTSTLKLLLIIASLFFIGSLAISAYLFFGGSNVVSAENIDIQVEGPVSIGGGDEVSLQISITNQNTVPIELADLLVEYPDGTRAAGDLNTELPRHRESIGTLKPGEVVKKTVRAILFGEEDTELPIVIAVEYRVQGSNAIFFKEETYQITLSSAPIIVSVRSLEEVVSGQDMEFKVTVSSNSDTVIEDVLLKAEYPFGFEFESSSPEPSFDTSIWELGDLPPGGEKTFTITGALVGQDNEERTFRFLSGIQSERNERKLAAAFGTVETHVVVKRPFIGVEVALNGVQTPEIVSAGGKTVRADIAWTNNLPTRVFDGEIEVRLSGAALDKSSVTVDRGFYRSVDNTVIWNRETDSALSSIEPGETGRVAFAFAPFGLSSGVVLNNPNITLDVSVGGRRLSDTGVPERVESTATRSVRVATDLVLTSRAVYFAGPFTNVGPLPPKAEQETTYTIIWTATNSSNRVTDAKITSTLPSYVSWKGVVIPGSEDVSFNPVGGIVTWDIGDLPAGSNLGLATKEVAFQVGILPSISQIGSRPVIVGEQDLSGFDAFTKTIVGSSRKPLSTRLSTDTGAPSGHDTVVE
jgi:hypothetical protein|tara:strand:- start:35037 stop:36950 length:1914 start_codon:yes stop_codon:yes gene_type:complete